MIKIKNKFIIIVPTYNAASTILETLDSIDNQRYPDLGIIIRNDMSDDNTIEIVRDHYKICNKSSHVIHNNRDVVLIDNDIKYYSAGNIYDSVLKYVGNPQSIIGVVDGDDKLIDLSALAKIEAVYDKFDSWLVWSQHRLKAQVGNSNKGYSMHLPGDEEVYTTRNYWAVSHFRTCRSWLFSLILLKDVLDPFTSGSFCKIAGDAALMYPIIEMCGNKKSYFLDEELYLYNNSSGLNEHALYQDDVVKYTNHIRGKHEIYNQLHQHTIPFKTKEIIDNLF